MHGILENNCKVLYKITDKMQNCWGSRCVEDIFTNFLRQKSVKFRTTVAKRTLSVREVWGSIPGPVKSTQCRQRFATVATFLRSCVAQALSRGDGPRNSLHASA